MDAVFANILNMGIAASWPILAVIFLRLFLKKSPKWLACMLWAVPAVRLACPFFAESAFSLIPSAETLSLSAIRYEENPTIHSGIPAINAAVNPVLGASYALAPGASVNPLQIEMFMVGIFWLAGFAVMAAIALFGWLRLCKKVREAALWQDNVWLCDSVESPFILGVVHPRIYLPSGMDKTKIPYVLAHERAHLKRKDHWWKLISYLLLAVYWFHPLVWVACLLFGRDMELACDEKVIREYDLEQRKGYSHAMVSCSMQKRMLLSCPLAFGEIGVKKRVKAVLHYKKPALWAVLVAVLVCIAAAVCFLTNPPKAEEQVNWAERPMLKMDGEIYVDPYKSESRLPYGYALAGTLSTEQAYNTGMEGLDYYTNPDYPDDFYVYQECGTPVAIDEEDNTQRRWAFRRWIKVDNNSMENKRLTLDDVVFLAQKGMDLDWEDFESYTYTETGFGLYIRVYEIDKRFSVWIGGSGCYEKSFYIHLNINDGSGAFINLRTDSVEEFIAEHSG